jgi:hypothetical protein
MSQKRRFPQEPVTKPGSRRPKGPVVRSSEPAPKSRRERAEAPTLPPPKVVKDERTSRPTPGVEDGRHSGVRGRRPAPPSIPAATVDEVVADLSKDPRRERDDD